MASNKTIKFEIDGKEVEFGAGDFVKIIKRDWSFTTNQHEMVLMDVTTVKTWTYGGKIRTNDGRVYKSALWVYESKSLWGSDSSMNNLMLVKITEDEFKAADAELDAKIAKQQADEAARREQQRLIREEKEREREEQKRIEKAQALAANPNIKFSQFAVLGNSSYYSANIIDASGDMNLIVVGVKYMKDPTFWHYGNTGDTVPMKWVGKVSWTEIRNSDRADSTPNGLSASSNDIVADTLDELFNETIYKVWRW